MKRWIYFGVLASLLMVAAPEVSEAQNWAGQIRNDSDLRKDPSYWRYKGALAALPSFRWSLGFGYTPNYFAPSNAPVEPYVASSLSIGIGWALAQAGVRGYWRDLAINVGWGVSKALTENIMGGQFARQTYARDIGVSIGKTLFRERNTGIVMSFGVGFKIPISLRSRQRTIITSISPGLSVSKTFLRRLSLSYSFGTSFNFYYQDAGVYNPELQGLPGLNQRWGMSHSLNVGFRILRGLSVGAGIAISTGYSFADAYTNPDGPQVFGSENLTAADLSSYAINESNGYSIFFSISYRLNRFIAIRASYANGGRQYEFQFNDQNERVWQIRNPFRLQNGSFSFGLSGSI